MDKSLAIKVAMPLQIDKNQFREPYTKGLDNLIQGPCKTSYIFGERPLSYLCYRKLVIVL
jgi:hypothetical protein